MNVPTWIIMGFQQQNSQDTQSLNNDTFWRLLGNSAQGIIGTEKNPSASMFLNFDDYFYFRRSGQFEEAFRILTKDDILKPCTSDHDFRFPNVRFDDIGCNFQIYKFWIYNIRKILPLHNQLMWNLNLMELFLMI